MLRDKKRFKTGEKLIDIFTRPLDYDTSSVFCGYFEYD